MKLYKTRNSPFFSVLKTMFYDTSDLKQRFYHNFSKQYNLDFFKNKFDQKNLILFSPNELKFNNFIHFQTHIDEFVKLFGKPKYSEISNSNPHICSYIYKTKISGIGCRCTLIFHKKKLVLFNYVFNDLHKSEKRTLLEYSVEKFGNKINATKYQIIDNNNNSLFIDATDNSLVFNFYAPSKILKKTFSCKPKEKKVINLLENKKQNTSV